MTSPIDIRSAVVVACVVTGLAACGSTRPPSALPPASGETITGRERLGWDQQASDRAELATFQFALYVDGVRTVMAGVTCDAVPRTEGFACAAPLPPLSAGPHVLELASFVVSGEFVLESSRSAPVRVTVATSGVGVGASASGAEDTGTFVTRDGVSLVAEVVADGFAEPVDLAQAADGRIFVAERAGRVLIVEPRTGQAEVALQLDDVDARGDGGLLSIALHPAFERTRHVFLVFTTVDRRGERSFELARFREAGGRLAERAVLLDGVAAAESGVAAFVRFGPDGELYVSFDAANEPELAEDLGSYKGKILRVSEAGTLPDDNPLPSLVFSSGHLSARGFDWQPRTGRFWVVGRGASGRDEAAVVVPGQVAGADRWMLSRGVQPGASGAVFYRAAAWPAFHGDLFVAAAEGGHLLRVRFDERDPLRPVESEPLFAGQLGPLRQVMAGIDGTLYVCTGHGAAAGAGGDLLIRLRPAS